MAIALVQSVTGTGNLTLNGVAAGNALIALDSTYRNPTTGAAVGTPTDSGGTFTGGIGGAAALLHTSLWDVGIGIFYQANAASGTHTVTYEASTVKQHTLTEFSGMATSGLLDVSATAKTNNGTVTSQATGTTGATAQNDELIIIGIAIAHDGGAANIGFTNPVSGFTTLKIISNTSADVGTLHAYKIVSASGTQSATFNWTDSEIGGEHAAIAAFKGTAGGAAARAPRYRPFPYKPGSPRGLR